MYEQQQLSGATLVSKPSTSFSTTSATSTASTFSSSSRLLFGEIECASVDTSSTKAPSCTVIQCSDPTFLRFWHSDVCRVSFLTILDKPDLAKLRLVCLDTSARLAPRCFEDIRCDFRANTFARRSRIEALGRIGRHVRTFRLALPYSLDHVLPPLIDPTTGQEKNFVYTPTRPGSSGSSLDKVKHPKYGDAETTDLLVRQYPPLFHAAANTVSFAQAFAALPSLEHLVLESQVGDEQPRVHHRHTSDFALTSIRSALEHARLPNLARLDITGLPSTSLRYLVPQAARPTSCSLDWSSHIHKMSLLLRQPLDRSPEVGDSQLDVVQNFLRTFRNLESLSMRCADQRSHCPWSHQPRSKPRRSPSSKTGTVRPAHPALRSGAEQQANVSSGPSLRLKYLNYLNLENMTTNVRAIQRLVTTESPILRDIDFRNVELESGTWEEALLPLTDRAKYESEKQRTETGDVPIILDRSPSHSKPLPVQPPLHRQDSGVSIPSVTPRYKHASSGSDVPPAQTKPLPRTVNFIEHPDDDGAKVHVMSRERLQRGSSKKKGHLVELCHDIKRLFRGGIVKWP